MAFTPPDQIPETEEELDRALAKVYKQGIEAGKTQLRGDIREFLTTKFFGAKGRHRRADPDDPKIQAIRELMEVLYEAFEQGNL